MARELSFDDELTASVRGDRLQLILLPTEQCNFRCTYCYEDFALGRMAPDVVSGIKNLIDRRADTLKHLQVSWFGGEPMLAASIIEDIASHAVSVQKRCKSLRYQGDMTTNGYFLDGDAAERLAGLGIQNYQISLDGPGECHDRTRLRADGKGTFERIWSNLLSIRDSSAGVHVMLRIHLTPENISAMPDFLVLVRETLLSDRRFTVFLKRVVRLGGPNDAAMKVLESDDQRIAQLRSLVLEGAGAEEQLYEPERVCYAARANSLLVRADGRLGKCTVGLSDPANTIGQLFPDGSVRIDNPRLRLWLQGWESRDAELTGCPYLAFTHRQPQLLQIH